MQVSVRLAALPIPEYLDSQEQNRRNIFQSIFFQTNAPLRRLTIVSSNFQRLNFDGPVLQTIISCCYNNDIKQMSDHY